MNEVKILLGLWIVQKEQERIAVWPIESEITEGSQWPALILAYPSHISRSDYETNLKENGVN